MDPQTEKEVASSIEAIEIATEDIHEICAAMLNELKNISRIQNQMLIELRRIRT